VAEEPYTPPPGRVLTRIERTAEELAGLLGQWEKATVLDSSAPA